MSYIGEPLLVETASSNDPVSKPLNALNRLYRFILGGTLQRYLLAGLMICLASIILFTALVGMAGLTFFFVQQFGADYLAGMLPNSVIDIAGGATGLTMFIAYAASLGPSMWHYTKLGVKRVLYGKAPVDDDAEDVVENEYRVSKRARLGIIIGLGVLSLIALLVIGMAAYLGIMTVANRLQEIYSISSAAFSIASNVTAATASISMFVAFSAFSIPRLISHINEILLKHPTTLSPELQKKANVFNDPDSLRIYEMQHLRTRLDQFQRTATGKAGRIVVAGGATVGFAAFKYYSAIHILAMFGVTAPVIVDPVGFLAFSSLFVMTGLTTGIKIIKDFKNFSERPDVKPTEDHIRPPSPLGRKIGWGVGFTIGLFMGIGAFMGVTTILAPVPVLNLLSIPLGLFIGVCRVIDFMCFTAPSIADTFGGQPFKDYVTSEPVAFTHQSEQQFNDNLNHIPPSDPDAQTQRMASYKNIYRKLRVQKYMVGKTIKKTARDQVRSLAECRNSFSSSSLAGMASFVSSSGRERAQSMNDIDFNTSPNPSSP